VVRSKQKMYLYINERLEKVYLVSTGMPGFTTPNFDNHPDGRIYRRFVSTTFPGGDYKGLGNMPYAVFLYSGFAIHGAVPSAFKKLGHTASHGCIRLYPDNALYFNELVQRFGVRNVWITVQ
jgi:lipoprotein-anchoring transpeptidase ErfK/SrfK